MPVLAASSPSLSQLRPPRRSKRSTASAMATSASSPRRRRRLRATEPHASRPCSHRATASARASQRRTFQRRSPGAPCWTPRRAVRRRLVVSPSLCLPAGRSRAKAVQRRRPGSQGRWAKSLCSRSKDAHDAHTVPTGALPLARPLTSVVASTSDSKHAPSLRTPLGSCSSESSLPFVLLLCVSIALTRRAT